MTAQIETVIKMMETLPEPAQKEVAEQVRKFIEELQDEIRWELLFKKSEKKLIKAANKAKQEIAEGKAEPMDLVLD